MAFKTDDSNDDVLKQFVAAGGGSVASAEDRDAVNQAFSDAARALQSQAVVEITRPEGSAGTKKWRSSGECGNNTFKPVPLSTWGTQLR